ncbi:hypothetical protein [Dokdonella sp.]|uniref:hypothetical protein n=1 Tax=Dokdonella sp. TaxID=2291710 RepID=UPI0031BD048A|nr:hypothetical protein [Dokdonella sp.]
MTALHVAAALIFLLGLAHSVLGERYILLRLFRRRDLPRLFGGTAFTTRTLRFAWHLTTVAWWGVAALLWQAGAGTLSQGRTLSIVGYTLAVSALLPLIITRGRHLAWVVLLAVAGIALWYAA